MFRGGYAALVALIVLIALSLRAPSSCGGLLADDWDHYAMSVGIYPVRRAPWDQFNFVGPEASDRVALQRAGRLPWWTATDLRIAMLRPLSSALHQVDVEWLGSLQDSTLAHVHSLGWWLLLVIAVACLLPRLLPLPAAALGTALFALDDAHTMPAAWIANRGELVANALVVWALYLTVRSDKWFGPGHLCAILLAGASLLAGEHAIPPFAYLVVYELRPSTTPWKRRWVRVSPFLGIITAYLIVRRVLGYGTFGIGIYTDPTAQPLQFLAAVGTRLPLLAGDVVFGVAADWYPNGPAPEAWPWGLSGLLRAQAWRTFQIATSWSALALLATATVWLGTKQDRAARNQHWLLIAAAVALVPMCASVAMSRLTLPAAIGVDAAWGWCTCELAKRAWQARRRYTLLAFGVVAGLVTSAHIVGAGLRSLGEAMLYAHASHLEEAWARLDAVDVSNRSVLVLTSGIAAQWVIPYVRHRAGLSMPRSSTPLSAAYRTPHEIFRPTDRSLELRVGSIRRTDDKFLGSVYRSRDQPFHVGDRAFGPDFDVTILDVYEGDPTRWRFDFRTSLDSAEYVFLFARPKGLVPFELPPVGQRFVLPVPAWPGRVSDH